MKSSLLSNLEGLVGLASRNGVDISHTLVRVLTDLYVQKPVHSDDEEQHYVELATRLLDTVDHGVRLAVATRLSRYAAAPLPILRKLARDRIEIATPILRHSGVLPVPELIAVAEELGPDYAAVVASRPEFSALINPDKSETSVMTPAPAAEIPEPAIASPALQYEPEAAPAVSETERTHAGENADTDAVIADPAEQPEAFLLEDESQSLSELFFAADPEERRLILTTIDFAPIAEAEPLAITGSADIVRRLEQAALLRNAGEFSQILGNCLNLAQDQARRLISDPTGETVVVAVKAIGMPADVLQRVLLFLNPVVGQSVQRVYNLSKLYEEISESAALRMIALWQDKQETRAARHVPAFSADRSGGRHRPAQSAHAQQPQRRPTLTAAGG